MALAVLVDVLARHPGVAVPAPGPAQVRRRRGLDAATPEGDHDSPAVFVHHFSLLFLSPPLNMMHDYSLPFFLSVLPSYLIPQKVQVGADGSVNDQAWVAGRGLV